MKPLKVLHFLDVEKEAFYFSNLADHVDRDEFEFSFVTLAPDGPFAASMRRRGIEVFGLDALSRSRMPAAALKFWRILRQIDPDIVHTHLFDPTVIGLNLAKWQGRKTMLTRHHSDALHRLSPKLRRSFYLSLERRNNRLADHIIAPAHQVRDCLVEWEGTPSDKVSLIPYPQTSERFDAITPDKIAATRDELGMNEQVSLVCISRLYHGKGHRYLFEAFAPLLESGINARLYLAGTGDHEDQLRLLADDLGIADNVMFLGWRPDVLEIIAAGDIVVHPSLEDALSQSLIESVMLKKPVVATDISGATDTLGGGSYGRLVPPEDPEGLRQALLATIENLADAKDMAAAGREYILDYMDAKRVTEEYEKLYRRIAG